MKNEVGQWQDGMQGNKIEMIQVDAPAEGCAEPGKSEENSAD
jgi:hypothetical protein